MAEIRVPIRWCITESITKAHYFENDDPDADDPPHVAVPVDILNKELDDYAEDDVLGIIFLDDERVLLSEPIRNNNIKSIFKAMRRGLKKILNCNDINTVIKTYESIGHYYRSNERLDKINKFEIGELTCEDLLGDNIMFYGDLVKKGNVWKMVIS